MSAEQAQEKFTEKRKHPRIATSNLVEYILYDEEQRKIDEGKGRTIDLSQSGALLETRKPLEGSFIILITLDLEGNKVHVRGRVANTRESEKKNFFLTGVEFTGSKQEQLNAVIAFVKAYSRRKQFEKNS